MFLAALMQKKGRSGHEMLVVVDFSIGTKINMCFFSSYNIYIYIHIFIYLSLYYHRYISTIHEEKLATLCPFSISSIF